VATKARLLYERGWTWLFLFQTVERKERPMCESSAYLVKGDKEELIMEDVSILRPEGSELYLQNIFGEQKRLKARIKEMNLLDHRLLLEEI
jgi:predicted RNA-binding protein